jgi:hypothetical protein
MKNSPSSPTQKSLYGVGRSTQKIGGLFNGIDSVVCSDYPAVESDEQAILQTYVPTPSHDDILEFLFPSIKSLVKPEPSPPSSPVMGDLVGSLMGEGEMEGVSQLDLGTVFADIEDLLLLDPAHMAELNVLHERSNVGTPAMIQTQPVHTPMIETPLVHLQTTHETSNSTSYPDHSYSTINQVEKRKFSEILNDDEENDEEDEDMSVCGSSFSGSVRSLDPVTKRIKYLERRKKNNVASKRSREIRKNKFMEMDDQAAVLEKANEELRGKIEQLERLTVAMKEALVAKLSTSK